MCLIKGITVIVPVYKCEKYIGKCIESIQNQTLKDWFLILVDDGSPDNAGVICDQYARGDNRIKVLHQTNGGPGNARNNGIEQCKTRWFTFIDSDDCVENDYLENFHLEIMDDDYSISIQGYKRIELDGTQLDEKYHFSEMIYRGKNVMDDSLGSAPIFEYGHSFGKLYNLKIVNEYRIRENQDIKLSEDHLFNIEYLCHVKSVYTHEGSKYCYQMADAEQSLSHRNFPWKEMLIRYNQIIKACDKLIANQNIQTNKVLAKINYFSVTAGLSLLLSSLYKNESNSDIRKQVLSSLNKNRIYKDFRPKSIKGLLVRILLLWTPVLIQDSLLYKYIKR